MSATPRFFLCQSRILPTNGEINRTPASAQATACTLEKRRVRLQCIPSFSTISAAFIPSHVEAIFISTRSREVPADSYNPIISRALTTVASVSKDRRASTSVEALPGTIFKISNPKFTANLSMALGSCTCLSDDDFRAKSIASSIRCLYRVSCEAV
ncbi:hypothetical protein SDC9_160571 [bioreactor metagenome]|uniref:Uncharacterized protein n=1 Tax=bioreactor metagenome TaxID=1076179 RepID=A0A645FH04_9ZZZZ